MNHSVWVLKPKRIVLQLCMLSTSRKCQEKKAKHCRHIIIVHAITREVLMKQKVLVLIVKWMEGICIWKNIDLTMCNKNAEESASCSGVTTSTVHQDSDSRHSCDSIDNSSTSSEFHLQSFGASSYSRLPTQVENEEVAPFINSDQSEDEGNTMTFEDEEEDFSNIDLYNEAVQPMSSPFEGPSVSRVSNILVHPRPVWQRFGASLNVDLPLLRVEGPLRDIESFALSCQAGNTDLDIGQSLVQVLPHWKSLSKLALVDAGTGK